MSRKGKGESAMRRWRRQRTCRRAPVPGRSQPRIARRARLHGGSGRCQHCCARGRALSAKASARRPGAMTKCLDTGARLSFDAKGVWRMDYELCLLRAPDAAPRSSGAGCGIPINPPAQRDWGSCKGDWSRSMKTTTARWRYECIPNSGTDPFTSLLRPWRWTLHQ